MNSGKAAPAPGKEVRAARNTISRRSKTSTDGRLEQALEILSLGLRPLPVPPGAKYPRIKWKGFQSVAPTEAQITEWWTESPGAEIAIVTGHAGGLDCLDLDVDEAGKLPSWPTAPLELPVGCVLRSPSGGLHYLFRHADGVRNSASELAPMVDVRGTGGLIVAIGKGREIETGSLSEALQTPCPDWLRDLLLSARPDGDHLAPVDVEGVLSGIPEGKRHAELVRYACRLRAKEYPHAEAVILLRHAAASCSPPYTDETPETIVDDVWRRYPPGIAHEEKPTPEAGTLSDARAAAGRWLELPDLDCVDVILATVIANAHAGDPVWVMLVGPPSSAKSELLRALDDAPDVFRLSSLTGKTLLSGHKDAGGGLLFRLRDLTTMVLLDFGQVLSLHPNDKALVLQRLREVYDGYTRGDFGNRSDGVEWKGKLGFLSGVTPAIEKYTSVGAELGDRFIFYPITIPDLGGQADDAIATSGRETVMRDELRAAFHAALMGAGDPEGVTLPVESSHALRDLSVLTVTLRTPVSRDRYTQTIDYLPQVEGPARLVKAMLVLGRALAALRGSDHVGTAELRTLAKMALRCIPSRRLKVVRALLQTSNDGASTKAVGLAAELPTTSTGYILEDLHLLGAVDRWATSDADTAPFHWKLKPAIAEKLIVAQIVSLKTNCS